MPPRKYPDLAHLSPEEYKIEAEKRRSAGRKEYRQIRYLNKTHTKEKLEEKIATLVELLEKANLKEVASV